MRKILTAIAAIAMTIGLSAGAAVPVNAFEQPDEGTVYMYRVYNPNSGEHFYTAQEKEKNRLIALGWHDEGFGWVGEKDQGAPVYRLYNQNGGEHHYTLSEKEKDALVAIGWKDEGIGWYSYDASQDTSKNPKNTGEPVYREYNPNAFANNHNYTTDKAEHDHLISLGWKDEGIAWYAKYRNVLDAVTGIKYDTYTRTLSWNPVKNATQYQIDVEKIVDGNPYTEVIYETVTGNSYVIPQAGTYSNNIAGTPGQYGVIIVAYDSQNHYLDSYDAYSIDYTYFNVK